MKNKDKGIGISLIIVSFFFLFNPNIGLIDILPDFIGYAIICRALMKFADLNEDIADARRLFSRMVLVDVAKIASLFVVFSIAQTDEQNTMLLLVTFIFAAIELFFLIPAYKKLFGGLVHAGYRFENTSVLGKKNERTRKNYTEKIASSTTFFVIFKTAMYLLPEFSVLDSKVYDQTLSKPDYLYNYIGLLRMFAIVACTVAGVVWLLKIVKYFRRVNNDTALMNALEGEYTEKVLPRRSLFTQRAVNLLLSLVWAAALLCIDLRVADVNIIPDVIAALVLISAVLSAKKYIVDYKKYLTPFIIYGVLTLGAMIIEMSFFDQYYYSAVLRNEDAFRFYCIMLGASVVDAAAFVCAVWGMIRLLGWVIENHTGFLARGSAVNLEDKIKRVHSDLKKKTYVIFAAALLVAVSDIFYDYGAATIEFAGIVNLVCSVIFFVAVYSVVVAISDEVQSKYMLD